MNSPEAKGRSKAIKATWKYSLGLISDMLDDFPAVSFHDGTQYPLELHGVLRNAFVFLVHMILAIVEDG